MGVRLEVRPRVPPGSKSSPAYYGMDPVTNSYRRLSRRERIINHVNHLGSTWRTDTRRIARSRSSLVDCPARVPTYIYIRWAAADVQTRFRTRLHRLKRRRRAAHTTHAHTCTRK